MVKLKDQWPLSSELNYLHKNKHLRYLDINLLTIISASKVHKCPFQCLSTSSIGNEILFLFTGSWGPLYCLPSPLYPQISLCFLNPFHLPQLTTWASKCPSPQPSWGLLWVPCFLAQHRKLIAEDHRFHWQPESKESILINPLHKNDGLQPPHTEANKPRASEKCSPGFLWNEFSLTLS